MSDPEAPFRLGRAVQLRPGKDVAVIACGALVEMAVRASDALQAGGHRRSCAQHAHDQAARSRRGPHRRCRDARHRNRGGASPRRAAWVERWPSCLPSSIPRACAWSACRTPSRWWGPPCALRAKYGMSAEGDRGGLPRRSRLERRSYVPEVQDVSARERRIPIKLPTPHGVAPRRLSSRPAPY